MSVTNDKNHYKPLEEYVGAEAKLALAMPEISCKVSAIELAHIAEPQPIFNEVKCSQPSTKLNAASLRRSQWQCKRRAEPMDVYRLVIDARPDRVMMWLAENI